MSCGCTGVDPPVLKSRPSRRSAAAIFLAAAAVTSVFFIDMCGLIYACGCRPLWAGAATHCNIHDPLSRHCPWCSIGAAGAGAIYAAIVAAQAAVVFLPWRAPAAGRFAAALLMFPAAAGVLGLIAGVAMGYWR